MKGQHRVCFLQLPQFNMKVTTTFACLRGRKHSKQMHELRKKNTRRSKSRFSCKRIFKSAEQTIQSNSLNNSVQHLRSCIIPVLTSCSSNRASSRTDHTKQTLPFIPGLALCLQPARIRKARASFIAPHKFLRRKDGNLANLGASPDSLCDIAKR